MRARRILLGLLAVAACASEAGAHARSTSTSSWDLEAGEAARVLVRVRWEDLQRALPILAGMPPAAMLLRSEPGRAIDDYLQAHFRLTAGGATCAPVGEPAPVPSLDPSHVGRSWRVRCASAGARVLEVDAFLEVVPGHLHLARVRGATGEAIERAFVLGNSSHALGTAAASRAAAGSSLFDYFRLGVEHIATGADHLVFLLALLLLGASIAQVATIVTGFTVAHSVTLALGVLGVVEPLAAAIESLIGLSIAIVALENFALTSGRATRRAILLALGASLLAAALAAELGALALPVSALLGIGLFAICSLSLQTRVANPARLRWLIAFVFGLIHGFGFAGMLAEIGLPPGRTAAALLGFNLGVEIGQLAIVAVCWPLLRIAMRRPPAQRRLLIQLGSSPILAAGLYWFLLRSFV